MRTKKFLLGFLIAAAILMLTVFSCGEPAEGPAGPGGPAGPEGPMGPMGPGYGSSGNEVFDRAARLIDSVWYYGLPTNLKAGRSIIVSENGKDVPDGKLWVTSNDFNTFKTKFNANSVEDNDINTFLSKLQSDRSNPYYAADPGAGQRKLEAYSFNFAGMPVVNLGSNALETEATNAARTDAIQSWRMVDGRIYDTVRQSQLIDVVTSPWYPSEKWLQLTITSNAEIRNNRAMGGVGVRLPIPGGLAMTSADAMTIEFDVYYPREALDRSQYMRIMLWGVNASPASVGGSVGTQNGNGANGTNRGEQYMRLGQGIDTDEILNPQWIENYEGQNWYKKTVSVLWGGGTQNGTLNYLNIDVVTENDSNFPASKLFIANVRFTKNDPSTVPIPLVDNYYSWDDSALTPLKNVYNQDTFFMVGSLQNNAQAQRHFGIMAGENNLKPEQSHVRYPVWLGTKYNGQNDTSGSAFTFPGTAGANALNEYNFPTTQYQTNRENGMLNHGHVLAWYSQSPTWMRAIVPKNTAIGNANEAGNFYGYGNSAAGPYIAVSKEDASRIQFDHIMMELRHFMSDSDKYTTSAKTLDLIPFHSYDVLNEEVQESRSSSVIAQNPNAWRGALKNTSWMFAMTDENYADLTQHHVYLLFKFAHMAIPNAQMLEKINANIDNPAVIPAWMKEDGHLDAVLIDGTTNYADPPLLTYNDYGLADYSKARVVYNMVKELNTLWKTDLLYDGRPLIEMVGIQGHDTMGPTLASNNQVSLQMYASLIDAGLLTKICISELDVGLPVSGPGGRAESPARLNLKQSDALGYQYALLYGLYRKYSSYMSHVITWGMNDPGWSKSYLLFYQGGYANKAFHGASDPQKYVLGHPYLDEYFAGEYEKIFSYYRPTF